MLSLYHTTIFSHITLSLPQRSQWVHQGPCLECGSAIGPLLVPEQCITPGWLSPWSPVAMSSTVRLPYLSALPENVDSPPRTLGFYRFLCFSFYFLKSQLSVSLLSHLPLLPPFRCFSTLDLYFLTSFCYSMREGKMDLVTGRIHWSACPWFTSLSTHPF